MKIIFLIGVPFSQWLKLITNKNIRFSLKFIFNYLIITIVSLLNQVLCVPERLFFNIKKDRKVEDPIFVIGLWRSGTTLLHFLLGQDKYFCTPNNFQCAFPHTFNVMQKLLPLKLDRIRVPRPQDNMVVKLDSPCEDEVAICSLLPNHAFYNYFFFSQNKEYFFDFLDFQKCSPVIISEWLRCHKKFHEKISQYYNDKRVVYKSPGHTAKIKHLIKIYPKASFVLITRHPLDIIQSTVHSIKMLSKVMLPMQKLDISGLEETTFMLYKNVLNRLDEDLSLLHHNQYCRIKYEDMIMSPLNSLNKIYNKLRLGSFDNSNNELSKYLKSIKGYKKNKYDPYSPELKARVLDEFGPYIKKWEYEK